MYYGYISIKEVDVMYSVDVKTNRLSKGKVAEISSKINVNKKHARNIEEAVTNIMKNPEMYEAIKKLAAE